MINKNVIMSMNSKNLIFLLFLIIVLFANYIFTTNVAAVFLPLNRDRSKF